MAHLGIYIDGICGGVDGVPVGMDSFSISTPRFERLYLAQDPNPGLINYGFPILQKIYLRCDPGYKVTSGSITAVRRVSDYENQLAGLGKASTVRSALYPFVVALGQKLFYNKETIDDDINKALKEHFTVYDRDPTYVDLSKYNITDTNACLALLIIPYNNEGATLQSLITLSFSEEVV